MDQYHFLGKHLLVAGGASGTTSACVRHLQLLSFSPDLAPRTLVNAVSPGLIRTIMTSDLVAAMGPERLAEIPLGRFGEPEDVAGVVGFLCGSAASCVTGQVITVNGGVING